MSVVITQAGGTVLNGDIIRATYFNFQNNQMSMPSVYFQLFNFSGVGVITLGDVASQLETRWSTFGAPRMSTSVAFVGTKASLVSRTPKPQPGIATDTTMGALAGKSLPAQVTGLLHLATTTGGRKGRGRVYLPFPNIGENDSDNTPTAGFVTGWNFFGADILSFIIIPALSGASCLATGVLWHAETGDYSFLNAAYCKKLYATQRRRGDYGRINADVIT